MSDVKQAEASREKKRAQFADPARKKPVAPALVIVFLLAVGAGYLVWRSWGEQSAPAPVQAAGGDVRIPLADLRDGKARFFDYTAPGGRRVSFFALKSTDGKYRAALNACDTCYAAKLGYRQQGNVMVCNQCGMEFPSDRINEVSGGCNPVGLPCPVEGDQVVIRAADLQNGTRYF